MNNNYEKFESFFSKEGAILEGGNRLKKEVLKTDKPTISVITVVLNGEKHLEDAFKSLHKQEGLNYEHIVIDGGSTDSTIEISQLPSLFIGVGKQTNTILHLLLISLIVELLNSVLIS